MESQSAATKTLTRAHAFASHRDNAGDWRFALKYAIDRVLALLMLLVLTPVLLAAAVAVRLSSAGPIFFRQRRVGLDGRVFEVFKFRTMAEQPVDHGFALPDGVAPGGVEGTDRRTGVGRWLRASSLDELPQLVNVLRGEMSLIGPRPERPEFSRRFAAQVPGYADRHRVKCGITGWAQANGLRGQTSIADRVAFDNYYIDNWSLGLELRTLALTLVEVLRFRDGRASAAGLPVATHHAIVDRLPEPVADQTCVSSASIAALVAVHCSCSDAIAASSMEPVAVFSARAPGSSCAAASASRRAPINRALFLMRCAAEASTA
jgi:lipopolysaccharide/colanic/teichoic acid biosynthesis glycosyltransferase